jgi:hypothetical protein
MIDVQLINFLIKLKKPRIIKLLCGVKDAKERITES